MTQKALMLYDLGKDAGEYSNMAKMTGVQAGLDCLDAAIQTHGGNGVAQEYQLGTQEANMCGSSCTVAAMATTLHPGPQRLAVNLLRGNPALDRF